MNPIQIRALLDTLHLMFPNLNQDMILRELDAPMLSSPDWDLVLKNAIAHAEKHNPGFLPQLEQVKDASSLGNS